VIGQWIVCTKTQQRVRFVGPYWVARLLCWQPLAKDGTEHDEVRILGRWWVRPLLWLAGARLEWRELDG